jgi:Lamin Tail Domain
MGLSTFGAGRHREGEVAMRRLIVVATLVVALGMSAVPGPVAAASCVRVVGGNWNPSGNENYRPALNAESTRIKNVCASSQAIGGWKLHDYGRKHTFTFPSGFKVGPGVTVSVYSGTGTRTSTKLYWGRTYGAIWTHS